MIATHVNFHDREVKSSMPYFGVFSRIFVHFHLYTTHDAVYYPLRDLNFVITALRHSAMYGYFTLPSFPVY